MFCFGTAWCGEGGEVVGCVEWWEVGRVGGLTTEAVVMGGVVAELFFVSSDSRLFLSLFSFALCG